MRFRKRYGLPLSWNRLMSRFTQLNDGENAVLVERRGAENHDE